MIQLTFMHFTLFFFQYFFQEGWDNHRLRTEGNYSPLQLWILGLSDSHSQDPDDAAVTGISVVNLHCYTKSVNTPKSNQ